MLSACTSATQTHSVYFDSGCLCSRLGYAFVVMDTTEYNLYQEWSSTRSDWLAEALYAESDIPGLLGSESALQALQIQPVFGNSFQANPTALADLHAVGRWHQGPLFFNSFLLWTNPQ